MLFVSLVYFWPLYRFISRNTIGIVECYIAILLVVGLFMSVLYTFLRPVLAYGILIYSIEFIEKKKIYPFLSLVIIATLIHISSVVFIPFYFLSHIKSIRFWLFAIAFIVPLLLINMDIIIMAVAVSSESERFSYYSEKATGAGTPVFTILFVFLFFFFSLQREKLLKKDHRNLIWGNALMIAVAMVPLTWFNQNLMRLLIYYTVMLTVLLGHLVDTISNIKIRKIAIASLVLLLLVFIIKDGLSSEYAFMWQPAQLNETYPSQKVIQESFF